MCFLSVNSYAHTTIARTVPLGKGFGLLTKGVKQRVALCFYGQPRFYNSRSYTWIKKMILDVYRPDVFFHTWWSPDDVGKQYSAAPQIHLNVGVEDDVVNQLVALYRPTRFSYEPSREFPRPEEWVYKKVINEYVPTNMMSMYYSMKQVRDMKRDHEKENGFKYDWVIRMRFDVDIFSFPEIGDLEPGQYYEPLVWVMPCDSMSISSSEHFDTVGDIYENLPLIWQNTPLVIFFEGVYTSFMKTRGVRRRKITWRFKYIRNYLDMSGKKEGFRAKVKDLCKNFIQNNYTNVPDSGNSFIIKTVPKMIKDVERYSQQDLSKTASGSA